LNLNLEPETGFEPATRCLQNSISGHFRTFNELTGTPAANLEKIERSEHKSEQGENE